MDLKSRAYAFFDPTTLFMFIDPFSPYKRVRTFLLAPDGGSYWSDAQELLAQLPQVEQEDLILRLSTYFHERQHFHDLLLSPYGSKLMRASFKLGVWVSALFGQLASQHKDSGRKIALPVHEKDVANVNLLRQTYQLYHNYKDLLEKARYSFEASAVITHRLGVQDALGLAADRLLEAKFSTLPLYAVPSAFEKLLGHILQAGEEINIRQMRQLALYALSVDFPDATLLNYLKGLRDVVDQFERGNKLTIPLSNVLDEGLEAVIQLFKREWGSNLDFLLGELVEDMDRFGFPKDIQSQFIDAFLSYMTTAQKVQELFVDNPDAFLDGAGLLNPPSDFIEPHTYWFVQPVNDHLAVLPAESQLDPDDLFSIREVYAPEGTLRLLRMMPAPVLIGEQFLDKAPWIEIAKGPAGAIALLEPPNFLHPFKSWWLRTMGALLGVQFVRSRSKRFPAQTQEDSAGINFSSTA